MKSAIRITLACTLALTLILSGCQGVQQSEAFQPQTIATSARTPVVTTTSPTGDVAPNKKSFVAFSKAMDERTITADNIFIQGVSGTVTYDRANRIAYVQPASNLQSNREYRLVVRKDVRSAAGMAMTRDHSFTFLTRERLGFSPPTVEPLPGPCIPPDGNFRVRFSEAMDSSTINTSTFLVAGVTGTVTYDALTRIATFNPSSNLTVGATYTVTIKAGVQDLGGVSMVADFVFTIDVCEEGEEPQDGYCTYTQGGYQGDGEPGQLLIDNFTNAFPQDMFIGLQGEVHYRWTSDQAGIDALREFLAGGGPSGPIPMTQTNPTASGAGALGTQVATLTLNVAFSGTEHMPAGFGDLVLHSTGTSLDGATVSAILAMANQALGGGPLPEGFTFSSLNDLITNLNESFNNCTESAWAKAHLREGE